MKDFKVLVKVNAKDPLATLAVLGQKVENDPNAFTRDIDKVWVLEQDYLAAVPIEIALTVEMRAAVQAKSPFTRFIITGVTGANVKQLVEEFGYVVYPALENPLTAKKVEFVDDPKLGVVKEIPAGSEEPEPVDEDLKEVENKSPKKVCREKRFFYNGEEITEEEFQEKIKNSSPSWVRKFFSPIDCFLD